MFKTIIILMLVVVLGGCATTQEKAFYKHQECVRWCVGEMNQETYYLIKNIGSWAYCSDVCMPHPEES